MSRHRYRPALEQLESRIAYAVVTPGPSLVTDPPGNAMTPAASPGSNAPLPGSVFTTTSDGSVANQNQFTDKTAVFIDVGASNQGKLPNGDYYFQVTDPNGSVLLS